LTSNTSTEEKRKLLLSLVFPAFFLVLIWMVKIAEITLHLDFSQLGIYPLHPKGLIGIITAPLIHANFHHLMNNSVPLFFLSWGLFYFYNKIAYNIFFLIYFMTGLWVWFGARIAYHIGASGLVYGLGSFLFFSGIIRRNINLLAISLLVAFLYGGMVWGIFPYKPEISWESHLYGGIAGLILSFYYRKEGPAATKKKWEDDDDELSDENKYWEINDDPVTDTFERKNEKIDE
jgi:membrane associated rhomboid family serine protease